MTKHTKGPWKVVQTAADRRVIQGGTEQKPITVIVADSWVKAEDAALISAAPEMLAALELYFSAPERFNKAASDAIAKAKEQS
jgi:hypothetical protein